MKHCLLFLAVQTLNPLRLPIELEDHGPTVLLRHLDIIIAISVCLILVIFGFIVAIVCLCKRRRYNKVSYTQPTSKYDLLHEEILLTASSARSVTLGDFCAEWTRLTLVFSSWTDLEGRIYGWGMVGNLRSLLQDWIVGRGAELDYTEIKYKVQNREEWHHCVPRLACFHVPNKKLKNRICL